MKNLRDLKAEVPQPEHSAFKAYGPGSIRIDMKYLPWMTDETSRRYLFAAIDLGPGYDHPPRNSRAAQVVIASRSASFRRCYGPEYISGKLMEWAEKQGVAILHIQSGQPRQNVWTERCGRTVGHEWLD